MDILPELLIASLLKMVIFHSFRSLPEAILYIHPSMTVSTPRLLVTQLGVTGAELCLFWPGQLAVISPSNWVDGIRVENAARIKESRSTTNIAYRCIYSVYIAQYSLWKKELCSKKRSVDKEFDDLDGCSARTLRCVGSPWSRLGIDRNLKNPRNQ